ncbi:mechanosensitive ion channel protein 10-like [Quercus robur]|uniref:mechanosensitive ion channel protein 10-like n=1 Tax=Quercus robur TaxID=38942 RepID=UPI002163EE24|nr:mechanosensitive ion channel protein 10-like [Quercus robur]XP_050270122.1 mechanosensitive ion channel protein 10-like [Quercus robur]
MERGKGVVAEKKGTNEVVLQIRGSEDSNSKGPSVNETGSYSFSMNSQFGSSPKSIKDQNLEHIELENLKSRVQMSTFSSSPSPAPSPTANKPPKIPNEALTRRKSLARSAFSKPKSRFVEPSYGGEEYLAAEKTQLGNTNTGTSNRNSPSVASPSHRVSVGNPRENLKSAPITPRTPLIGTGEEEDDEEVYMTANLKVYEINSKKFKKMALVEWIAFVCIMGVLIASLIFHKLQNAVIWSLHLWKWSVLVLVIFCGRLVTEWFINVLVFLIELNFLLKKKVLYFVYGLKKSVQVFIWLGLILLAWGLLFDGGTNRTKRTSRILNYITRALAGCFIGAAIWLVKNLLVKLLASSFQCTRFFDRIQESIFHQYVLRTLSGPPLMEMAEKIGSTASTGHLSFTNLKEKTDAKEEVIDVDKLKKMKQEKISAWTMKGLINVIRDSGLSTISNTLDSYDTDDGEQRDEEITSEWEAKAAAYRIFHNVAKPGSKYMEEEDLLRFMKKEEVDNVFPLFEGAVESGKIKRKSLKNWLVKVYLERKSLVHSLNDTKTAVDELNKLVSVLVLVVDIIVCLLLMGFLTTQILVFISSQLLLVAFMFGNTAKTVFEAIIFVFVMHPFDVGDRCVIDGVQMTVEEMNILTTVFLRYDNEKIFYPNSVLLTKPISNFYRSPDMSDSVEFAVDVSTSIESIGALKARIKTYLESKPQHWRPGHNIQVKEIEDVNKMKMGLYVTHTINFQNAGDRNSRRSELVLELKKIFQELSIKYHLLPQEVHLRYVGSAPPAFQP